MDAHARAMSVEARNRVATQLQRNVDGSDNVEHKMKNEKMKSKPAEEEEDKIPKDEQDGGRTRSTSTRKRRKSDATECGNSSRKKRTRTK